jgi:hypothetical protein
MLCSDEPRPSPLITGIKPNLHHLGKRKPKQPCIIHIAPRCLYHAVAEPPQRQGERTRFAWTTLKVGARAEETRGTKGHDSCKSPKLLLVPELLKQTRINLSSLSRLKPQVLILYIRCMSRWVYVFFSLKNIYFQHGLIRTAGWKTKVLLKKEQKPKCLVTTEVVGLQQHEPQSTCLS